MHRGFFAFLSGKLYMQIFTCINLFGPGIRVRTPASGVETNILRYFMAPLKPFRSVSYSG